MNFDIKEPSLVYKEEADTLIVHNINPKTGKPTKLSEVLNFLPAGIIYKAETGMGATTLELRCPRNSIIVEPLRSTAFNKSKISSNPYPALYVGTKPDKGKSTTKKEIRAYLKGSKEYKKILVVADSLHAVLSEIDTPEDYFLLLDESDSFQMSSTFRDSMDECVHFYKKFPQTSRAMVTATPLEFSDPELKSEKHYTLKYKTKILRDVDLVETEDWLSSLIELIVEHFEKRPSEKLMVALNMVSSILNVIENVASKPALKSASIKVLCSQNPERKVQVGPYYSTLDDGILPGDLNFITSAYFTGVDINEPFHLITVVVGSEMTLRLSEKTIKQVSGRCRPSLGSETILYQLRKSAFSKFFDFDQLKSAAESEITALGCIRTNYEHHPVLKDSFETVRSEFIKSSVVEKFRLLFQPKNDTTQISYLNIDAYLEAARTAQEIYTEKDGLRKALDESGCNVSAKTHTPTLKALKAKKVDLSHRDDVRTIKNMLSKMSSGEMQIDELLLLTEPEQKKGQEEKQILDPSMTLIRFQTFRILLKFGAYFDKVELLKIMLKKLDTDKSHVTNSIEQIYDSLNFAIQDPNTGFKKDVLHNFKIGHIYEEEEILETFRNLAAKHGLFLKMEDINGKAAENKLKRYFVTKSVKLPSGKKVRKIMGLPFKPMKYKQCSTRFNSKNFTPDW